MIDLLELPINPEYYPEDTTFDLWVYLKDEKPVVFKDVTGVIRSSGFWSVSIKMFGKPTEAMFPAGDVIYFCLLVNLPVEDDEDDDCVSENRNKSAADLRSPIWSDAVSAHDPVCPASPQCGPRCECAQCECQCATIDKARADEKDSAAQRVINTLYASRDIHDSLCPDQDGPNGGWLHCDLCDLIARVRADESDRIYDSLSDDT